MWLLKRSPEKSEREKKQNPENWKLKNPQNLEKKLMDFIGP